MKWEMEMEEIEAVLERIWDFHDKISDAIHAISRADFLKSTKNLNRASPEKKQSPDGDLSSGGGEEGSCGYVFVKGFRVDEGAVLAEAKSLNAISTALENLEDQLEFFHVQACIIWGPKKVSSPTITNTSTLHVLRTMCTFCKVEGPRPRINLLGHSAEDQSPRPLGRGSSPRPRLLRPSALGHSALDHSAPRSLGRGSISSATRLRIISSASASKALGPSAFRPLGHSAPRPLGRASISSAPRPSINLLGPSAEDHHLHVLVIFRIDFFIMKCRFFYYKK